MTGHLNVTTIGFVQQQITCAPACKSRVFSCRNQRPGLQLLLTLKRQIKESNIATAKQ